MKIYDYVFHFTNGDSTVLGGCDRRVNWKESAPNQLFQFNTPTGTLAINLNHVTRIDETIKLMEE